MRGFYVDARWRMREFFRNSGATLIFLSVSLILGVVAGVVAGAGIIGATESETVTDYTIKWYLGQSVSFGSYFGRGVLDIVCCFCLILFTNWTVALIFGNYLLLILKGYTIGFNALVIIGSLGIGGFFQIFFIFIPQQLLLCSVLIYVSVCASKRCLGNRGCGLFIFRGVEYGPLLRKMTISILVYIVCNLFLSLLYAIMMSNLVFH